MGTGSLPQQFVDELERNLFCAVLYEHHYIVIVIGAGHTKNENT